MKIRVLDYSPGAVWFSLGFLVISICALTGISKISSGVSNCIL